MVNPCYSEVNMRGLSFTVLVIPDIAANGWHIASPYFGDRYWNNGLNVDAGTMVIRFIQ